MRYILDKWKPNNCFFKLMKKALLVLYVLLNLAFIVFPFFGGTNARNVLAIIWYLSCVFMLDSTIDDFVHNKKQGKPTESFMGIPIIFVCVLVFISNYFFYMPWFIILAGYFIFAFIQEIIIISVKGKFVQWPLNKIPILPKKARLNAVGGMFYGLALVVFLVAVFYNKVTIEYIAGAIVLIFIIISISQTIPNWGEKNKTGIIAKLFTIIDFLSALAVIIYLIYLINDATLQNIVLIISSAMTGGLLTLSGVAWTIKRQDKIRREDETNKNKPILIIADYELFDMSAKEDLQDLDKYEITKIYDIFPEETVNKKSKENGILLKNVGGNICKIVKANIDGINFCTLSDYFIEKDKQAVLNFHVNDDIISDCHIYLEIQDIFGNTYTYKIVVYYGAIQSIRYIDKEKL